MLLSMVIRKYKKLQKLLDLKPAQTALPPCWFFGNADREVILSERIGAE